MFQGFRVLTAGLLLATSIATHAAQETDRENFKSHYAAYNQYAAAEDWTASLPHAEQSWTLAVAILGEDHRNTAKLSHNYALNLSRAKQHDQAAGQFEAALDSYHAAFGASSAELVPLLIDYSEAHTPSTVNGSRWDNKRGRMIDRAVSLGKQHYGDNTLEYAQLCTTAGKILLARSYSEETEEYLYRGYRVSKTAAGDHHPSTGYAAFTVGEYELSQKKYHRAETYLTESLAVFERDSVDMPDTLTTNHALLVKTYMALGEPEKAEQHRLVNKH